jgi:prolyl 4-hydroxylase
MARLNEAQIRASKRLRTATSSSKWSTASQSHNQIRPHLHLTQSTIKIAAIFLALVPLALPLYWSSPLLLSLQPYIPQQLRRWLPKTLKDNVATEDIRLSPEALVSACSTHQYTSQIISLDPLVIYINNFTSRLEAEELINIG